MPDVSQRSLPRGARKCRRRTWAGLLQVVALRTELFDADITNRKGGPLAVTDANLILGRLIPDFFPKIFGKSEKEPLDVHASKLAFEKVAREINEGQEKDLSLDEIVYGFSVALCFDMLVLIIG